MMTIDYKTTPIRNPIEGVWELYSGQNVLVGSYKSRVLAVEAAHAIELIKIRRIKALEQLYSRYKGLSLYGVN